MGKVEINSKFLLVLFAFASLIFVFNPVFAEHYENKHGTSYNQVGNSVTITASVNNPTNQTAHASIEFAFENVEGNNYWDTKQHFGEATANKSYGTHQDYFVDDVGRFFITIIEKIDGKIIETSKTDYIVYKESSDAALNGCSPDHELVVKPDYSQAVCVFDKSVIKLLQRGWIAKTIFSDERILEYYKTLPEVKAFYAKYNDAQASVREDHISYFAGSDDDTLMRMNVFFDENQTLDHIDTHCYFQKIHQYEIPQEDIVNKLEKYDCKK